ncbi:MAG: ATP-binding protein [Burkholderiaceae bacterium]
MSEPKNHGLAFLIGGGQLGRLIAEHDWSRTHLGSIEKWAPHVKVATAIMLRSRVPIVMLWGEPGVMIYNDAYSVFAGARHPQLLGADVREGWHEVADFNDNVMKVGLTGHTLSYQDQELTLRRNGRDEQVWMNLDYSPLLDEQGEPAGVMAIVVETSAKVLAERRLSGERERLSKLFEQGPSFMAMLHGPEHRFELANRSYKRLVGDRALIGRTVAEALPEAAAQGYVALLDQVFRSGETFSAHGAKYAVQLDQEGPVSMRYVDFVYQPIRGESGQVTDIFVEGVEVTARIEAEARREALVQLTDRLREAQGPEAAGFAAAQLLGEILNASRVGYATIDPDSETLHVDRDWNAPGVETLAGNLRLRDYGSFIDSLKRNEFISITDVRTDPRTAQAAHMLERRSARAFVNVPVVEQGRLVAVLYVNHASPREWSKEDLAFVREVANRTRMAVERVKGEAAQRAAERAREDAVAAANSIDRQFRALVTASSDVVYRMNADWSEMDYLQGRDFVSDTQAPSVSWLGNSIPEIEHGRVMAAVSEAIRTRSVFELEHQIIRADGTIGWTFSRAIPIFDAHGEIVEWFGAASDVTRRKVAEQELQQSEERLREADRRKDEFLAILAHELRNPLAPIRNAVSLLATLDKREQLDKLSNMLDRQVSHMVRLVDDLLEVSRISRGQIALREEIVNIRSVLDAAVESSRPLIEQARHRLTVEEPQGSLWVRGDAVRLSQVFVNLLNNAARYTDPGGEIALSFAEEEGEVVIQVEDTGTGISEEQLPRIFEMFAQADGGHARAHGGLGIGLGLSKRLVEMHGGTISAASAGRGHGSRFTVRLPVIATAPDEAISVAAKSSRMSENRILVVDDNEDAADSTAMLLSMLGAQVRVAYDGATAMNHVHGWAPTVVLLDLGMPNMDGYELARRIRAASASPVPLMAALTGWGQEQDRARSQASGFDLHLVKPMRIDDLERLLSAAKNRLL